MFWPTEVTEIFEDSNAENKEFVPKLMSNEEKETLFAKLQEDFKQKLDKVNKPLLDRQWRVPLVKIHNKQIH